MSTIKSNNVQVGQSVTASNNFTLYQPASPDGTVRLGVGNSGSTTADVLTASSTGVTIPSVSSNNTFGFKNRIINGGMTIDQRNAGASVTINTTKFTLDRWSAYTYGSSTSIFSVQQNAGSITPPSGYQNYLGVTSLSAYTAPSGSQNLIYQALEGYNTADLSWGTVNAKTITLSFQVYSSLTGTFGGALQNYAATRSYPFSYTVSSANTWTQISLTIPGDTGGTWVGASSAGSLTLNFSIGSGSTYAGTAGSWSSNNYVTCTGATSVLATNGATFYITGVQLEVGSQATSFDFRSIGQELSLCQRYFQLWPQTGIAYGYTSTGADGCCPYIVPMRSSPTFTANTALVITDVTTADYTQSSANIAGVVNVATTGAHLRFGNFSGLTASKIYLFRNGDMFVNASAEL